MFSAIYVESELRDHPRVKAICDKFGKGSAAIPIIECERYTELFNRKAQNFRLQKQSPALILARKHANYVLPAPSAYNIGGKYNYYFSHMLNCLYDCRYCFLQGMFQSANYVLFINYEDFAAALQIKFVEHQLEDSYYFSGYDCDSLAFEPVSQFVTSILKIFKGQAKAILELRTKSTQIRSLLDIEPMDNVIVAFSFTPDEIASRWEDKAPSVAKRIAAITKLAKLGWKIGLRFDPLIYHPDFQQQYENLFKTVFSNLSEKSIHSVSLGLFRLPEKFHKKMTKLFPDEALFVAGLSKRSSELNANMISYKESIEANLFNGCEKILLDYIPASKFFSCQER